MFFKGLGQVFWKDTALKPRQPLHTVRMKFSDQHQVASQLGWGDDPLAPPAGKEAKPGWWAEQGVAGWQYVDLAARDGKATLKLVTIAFGDPTAPRIDLLLVVPNQHRGRVPVFLGMNFCGNHALIKDPRVPLTRGWVYGSCAGCQEGHATEAGRGSQAAACTSTVCA